MRNIIPLGTHVIEAQRLVILSQMLRRIDSYDALNHGHDWCHPGLGHYLHVHLHLSLRPDRAAVVHCTSRTLHGPDNHHDIALCNEYSHRLGHHGHAYVHHLAFEDAEDRKARYGFLFRAWVCVSRAPTHSICALTRVLIRHRCCIIGVVRIVELVRVDLVSNITGTMGDTILLLGLELIFGIMCTNIPMMRPFYARYRSRKSSSKLEEEPKRSDPSNNSGSHASGARQRIARRLGIADDQTIGIETALELENYNVLGIKSKTLVEHRAEENGSDDGNSERRLTESKASTPTNQVVKTTHWTITRD